ncbi:MAG: hypothetical protein ACI8PB_000630 [Desulforhopalus sp.]|jgi:uncharacterized protein (DUF342 family)
MNQTLTTHFQSQTISTTGINASSEVAVSGLMRQGQILLSVATADTNTSIKLVAGSNCLLSEDSLSITAEASGFSTINKVRKGNEIVVSIEITRIVNIADDKMLATLTLYPPIEGIPEISFNDILAICNEHEMCCGIDEVIIRETIRQVYQFKQSKVNIPIARGLLPVNGNDAYLRFEVEIGPLPGKILQDGSIDWRERKMFVGIDKDELIATKVPLTQGTPGTDIHSLPILQKPGKDIKVKVAGDVQYNEESRQILAICSGVLSIVNGTDVKVSAKQTIDGDVDFSVGNIESNDGLEIKGDVKPGFTVSCKGDLSIGGNIQNAIIHARGNSKIASGLMGEHSSLLTDGDLKISFVERGQIKSGGNVIISKGAYYAQVSSQQGILCHPDSKIVGGIFCCGQDFIGGIVGSDNATPIRVVAGVDPERFQQRYKLRSSMKDQEQELEDLIQMNGPEYTENALYKKKETALQKRKSTFKKLNLISGSPLYSRLEPTSNYCSATISVQGKIFSGTKLRIGNIRTTITEEASSIRFYIDRKTGHIVAIPYTHGK